MINLFELYNKLKDKYEVHFFRWQTRRNKKGISQKRKDIDPKNISKHDDCILTARGKNVSITASNILPQLNDDLIILKREKPYVKIITRYDVRSIDDLKEYHSAGLIIIDNYYNIENLLHPEYEEDGCEAWLTLPDTGDAIATIVELKTVPKNRLEAVMKLIELGQPVEQFYAEKIETLYDGDAELWAKSLQSSTTNTPKAI